MEQENKNQLPGEVVECYRQKPREVVETYRRPLVGVEEETEPELPMQRRNRHRGLWIFLLCGVLVLAALLGAGIWNHYHQPDPPFLPDVSGREDIQEEITIPTYPFGQGVTVKLQQSHGRRLSAEEVYRRVNPSVVAVMAQLEDGMSVGTGIIVREDGYILTNHHVLAGGQDCLVTLDNGRSYEAKFVAGDAANDLAVIKVELTGLPAAELGSSDQLQVGNVVYAIGNPLGMELRGTLTEGIVSAINRDVEVDGRTMTLIQTTAALNSGNSGGPLINVYGQVVGINTVKMISSYSNVEGLGFAIPSSTACILANQLLEQGEVPPEPVIGVSVTRAGTELKPGIWAIEVLEVTEGSPAEKAGIQVGDRILRAGGIPTDSSQALLRARRQYQVGENMELLIWRDGEELTITLHLDQAESRNEMD